MFRIPCFIGGDFTSLARVELTMFLFLGLCLIIFNKMQIPIFSYIENQINIIIEEIDFSLNDIDKYLKEIMFH